MISSISTIKIYNTHKKPLQSLNAKNNEYIVVTEDAKPQIPSNINVVTNTHFLPFVSAKHPQKYDPTNIPIIGAPDNTPLLVESIWKSHEAAGSTNDSTVTPRAVLAYIAPQISSK